MKKILSLLLALMMVALVFVSCKKDADNTDDTSVASSTADTSGGEEETKEGYAKNAYNKLLKDAGKFDGETFMIVCGGNVANNDFQYEEDSAEFDNLESAEYQRRKTLEEDLDITIEVKEVIYWPLCFGGGPFHQDMETAILAGNEDYDIIYGGIYEDASLTTSGYLQSLSSAPYVNLSESWYDQDAIASLSIGGNVFFINGDYSIYDDEYNHCILFNKQIADDLGYDPQVFYNSVNQGTWTVDSFGGYVKGVYNDLNGNQTPDYGDRFGLLTWNDSACAMITACGTRIATLNSDNQAELTMMDDKVETMLTKYLAYAYDSSVAINYQTLAGLGITNEEARDVIFTSDQAFFAQSMITYVRGYRGMISEFGILPYPKYTDQQKDYYTFSTLSVQNAICIPLVVENIELTGAFLEAASILGQLKVVPEYYDVTLQRKVTRDEDSRAMLDIIFKSRVYDVGMFYNVGDMYSNILTMFSQKNNSYHVLYAAYRSKMNNRLEEINSSIAELLEEQ